MISPILLFSQDLGRIAVSRIEGPNTFYSRNFSNKLEKELAIAGFDVVERRDVNKIMDEWRLQSSGMTDGGIVEFNGISNADYLIVGTFLGINDYSGIFASIQMINIDDGTIINTASIDGQISQKSELYTIGIESLAEQLINDSNSKMDLYIETKNKETLRTEKLEEQKEKEIQKQEFKKERRSNFWRLVFGTIELLINILEIFNKDDEQHEDYS